VALSINSASSQTITGAWKGRIGSLKTELKLIKKGDSLLGTSYYYFGRNVYRRYSVKGYFDPETNSVIWWDDVLLEEKGVTGTLASHKEPFLSVADFNCPGENKMLLEGKSSDKNDMEKPTGPVNMEKTSGSAFSDEWDYVLDNYFVGANDPDIIDSVAHIAFMEPVIPEGFEGTLTPPVVKVPVPDNAVATKKSEAEKARSPIAKVETPVLKPNLPVTNAEPPVAKAESPVANAESPVTKAEPSIATSTPPGTRADANADVKSIEQKFATRKNKLQTVIPITSDQIELRFYDNAQVDGDSISF
jgi:hypothetical protein